MPSSSAMGLTLLELLVTLAILSCLVLVAVPNMSDQLREWRARSWAEQLHAAAQSARNYALMEKHPFILCPALSGSGGLESCEGDFTAAVALYASTAEGRELVRLWTAPEGVRVHNRSGTDLVMGELIWDEWGLGSRALSLSVCAGDRNWSVVINRLGRPRLARGWGQCPVQGA